MRQVCYQGASQTYPTLTVKSLAQ